MQKYRDNITIQGRGGLAPVRNANVTVYNHGTNDKAIIYTNALKTPKANPFQADALGAIFFYAENGHYDIFIQGDGQQLRIDDILMEEVYEEVDDLSERIVPVEQKSTYAYDFSVAAEDKTDPSKGASVIGYLGSDVHRKLRERVSPEDFGAGRPGISDQDAWESMLDAVHNDPEFVDVRQIEAKGSYSFTRVFPFHITKSGLVIDGCGSGELDFSGVPQNETDYFWRVSGEGLTGAQTTATADIVASPGRSTNYYINVASTAGFQVGDAVLVTSIGLDSTNAPGEYFMGIKDMSGFTPRYKGFVGKIKSIPDEFRIGLEWGPSMSMDATGYKVNVRGARLLDGFSVRNFSRIFGGTDEVRIDSDFVGLGLARLEYTENVRICFNEIQAFGGNFASSVIGINHRIYFCDIKNTHQGWNVHGIEKFSSVENRYQGGRRMYNTDATPIRFINPDNWETVQTGDVLCSGGSTYNAYTGPGGHLCIDQRVANHKTRNVSIGINSRGKRLIVTGCDIEAGLGIGAGYDAAAASSPTYDEVPDMEYLYVDNSTNINATGDGIRITSTIQSGGIHASITALNPIRSWAKYLNNIEITGNLIGTDPDNSIGFYIQAALRLNNIKLSCTFKNLNVGAQLASTSESSPNVGFDGCMFDGVTFRFVRYNSQTNYPSSFVVNCKHTTLPSGDTVGGFTESGHTIPYQYNNTWSPLRALYTVVSGEITLVDPQPHVCIFIANGTSNVTLSTVTGIKNGQQITIFRGGTSGTVTVNSSGNLRVAGGSIALNNPDYCVTLTGRGASIAVETGRYTG